MWFVSGSGLGRSLTGVEIRAGEALEVRLFVIFSSFSL